MLMGREFSRIIPRQLIGGKKQLVKVGEKPLLILTV
jgi:hypothetical protein